MALSSNTLFHFTDSLEILYRILEEGFWPKYCKETGWKGEGDPLFATSMVCFCNIPLSQIQQHINYYGYYGIGVSKEWALNTRIRPVFYVTREMIPDVQKLAGKVFVEEEASGESRVEKNIIYMRNYKQLLSMMKIYEGWNWKEKRSDDKIICKEYAYYDEREWRFVPEIPDSGFLVKVRGVSVDLEQLNQKSKAYCIKPDLKDIKYVIIKSEDERMDVLKKIDELFSTNTTASDISLLKSKILTCKQLNDDF